MSNIGSRTSCTIAATAAATAPVLGYDYASNIVLEKSMMQVSFGLTIPTKVDMPLNKETKPKDLLGETWGGSFSLFLVIYIYIYIYIYIFRVFDLYKKYNRMEINL